MKVFVVVAMIFGLLRADFSFAGVMDYLRGYKLGVNLIGYSEGAQVKFNVDTDQDPIPADVTNCGEDLGQQFRECSVHMHGGGGSGLGASYLAGFGLYLQQPFKRQGTFYFNWDLGIGIQSVSASIDSEDTENNFRYAGLTELSYHLYGLQLKPYIQIGWTPNRFPDFIFTLGPVVQMVAGNVSVNEEEKFTAFVQSSDIRTSYLPWAQAYFEFEIVFYRFGSGAFSWYYSKALAGNAAGVGEFYSEDVGAMSDFSASFNAYEGGFKLLLNWP